MMKVLYIDPQSYNNLAQYDYNLHKNLQCEIVFCCSQLYDAPSLPHVAYRTIFNYSCKKNNALKAISYVCSLIRLLFVIIAERPDVIHVQWWRLWHADYLMLYVYKWLCRKVVFTAHNVVPHNTYDTMKAKCIKYYRKVDNIIVHADTTKRELVDDFCIDEKKISVIHHGLLEERVDEDKVRQIATEFANRHRLKDKLVFASLGIQSEYKGSDIIKRAFLNNKRLQRDSFLIFAGKGTIFTPDDAQGLDNIYVDNNFVSREFFHAMLSVTDVLLLPYLRISQSGVLLTALANQVPYIATNVGGLTEPFSVAEIGWQIDAPDEQCLSVKIESLLSDAERVKRMKHDDISWGKVKKLYQWDIIGKETLDLYRK